MAKSKNKFYTVWIGRKTGVFGSWDDCKTQVFGFDNAKYKGYASRAEAEKAFTDGWQQHYGQAAAPVINTLKAALVGAHIPNSLAVDAASSGNPGPMEYRGVLIATGEEVFRIGPLLDGTNNVGEFLGLVHGLAWLKRENLNIPIIYSDSRTAIAWVKAKKHKSLLELTPRNAEIFDLLARAERWLSTNTYTTQILKWETAIWGEIPADFGRK